MSSPWTQLSTSASPGGLRGSSLVSDAAGNLYLLFGSDSLHKETNNMYKLNFSTTTPSFELLQTNGTPPSPRSFQSVVCADHYIYIFGGEHESYALNDFHRLNLKTLEWSLISSSAPPPARFSHSMCFFGECIVLYGGASRSSSTPRNSSGMPMLYFGDLWVYNITLDSWTEVNLLEKVPGRYGSSLNVIDDSMIVFGGYNEHGKTNQLLEILFTSVSSSFNLSEFASHATIRVINPVSLAPPPRHNHAAARFVVEGKHYLLVFGGNGEKEILNDLWLYDHSGIRFTQCLFDPMTSSVPQPRHSLSVAVRDGKAVFFGGVLSNGNCASQLLTLDLAMVLEEESRHIYKNLKISINDLDPSPIDYLPSGRNPFLSTLLSSDRFLRMIQRVSDDNMKARVEEFKQLLSAEEIYRKNLVRKVDTEMVSVRTKIAVQYDVIEAIKQSVTDLEGGFQSRVEDVINEINSNISLLDDTISSVGSSVQEVEENVAVALQEQEISFKAMISSVSNLVKQTIDSQRKSTEEKIEQLKTDLEQWVGESNQSTVDSIELVSADVTEFDQRLEYLGAEVVSQYESLRSELIRSVNDIRLIERKKESVHRESIEKILTFTDILKFELGNCLAHCRNLGEGLITVENRLDQHVVEFMNRSQYLEEQVSSLTEENQSLKREGDLQKEINESLIGRLSMLEEHF
ncbi:hypothetical protein GEMRC1_004925 [Eukaryota sp. GEM-RC1]